MTSDPRSPIRKSSLEVLFNILKDHGHLFSRQFWVGVINSVVFPIFNSLHNKKEEDMNENDEYPEGSTWDSDTCAVAADCLVDLFVNFFNVIRSQLPGVVVILTGFIRSPIQGPASTGVAALMRLAGDLGNKLTDSEWREIFLALKEAATLTVPAFIKVLRAMDAVNVPRISQSYDDMDVASDLDLSTDGLDDDDLHTASYIASRMKSHISMQLLIIQVSFSFSRFKKVIYFSEYNIFPLFSLIRSLLIYTRTIPNLSLNPTFPSFLKSFLPFPHMPKT